MPYPDNFDSHAFNSRYADPAPAVAAAKQEFKDIEHAIERSLADIGKHFASASDVSLTDKDIAEMRYALAELAHDVLKDAADTLEAHDEEVPDLHKAGA